jgi:site-specific recombinase XerD
MLYYRKSIFILETEKTETRIVNIDEDALGKLVSAPNLNTFAGIRDYALILLQLDTGIRPKEALTLIETDVCFNPMLVNIKAANSKTKNTRSLPISPITAQAIKKLLSFKHELWRTDLVFCTFDGKPVDRRNWSRRLAYYSKKINTKIRPYDLRHSFALQL